MPSLLWLSAEQVSENISMAMANYPQIFTYITCFIRYALVILALLVVVGCGISLLRGKRTVSFGATSPCRMAHVRQSNIGKMSSGGPNEAISY